MQTFAGNSISTAQNDLNYY